MREHVDLPLLDSLEEEWRLHPPVHHLVAAYIGYSPRERTAPVDAGQAPDQLLADLGGIPVEKVAPVDTSAFDARERTEGHG